MLKPASGRHETLTQVLAWLVLCLRVWVRTTVAAHLPGCQAPLLLLQQLERLVGVLGGQPVQRRRPAAGADEVRQLRLPPIPLRQDQLQALRLGNSAELAVLCDLCLPASQQPGARVSLHAEHGPGCHLRKAGCALRCSVRPARAAMTSIFSVHRGHCCKLQPGGVLMPENHTLQHAHR